MKRLLAFFASLALLFLSTGAASKTDDKANANRVVLTKDNTVVMDQIYDSASVANATLQARALDSRLPSGDPLYLVIVSGGGSIEAGLELINNLKTLNRPVHTVSVFAASMAFQTVQGLGTRYVAPTGVLMSHRAKGGFEGEFPGQFDSRYSFYLKRILTLDERTVARSGGKLTLEKYRELYANEFWCQGQECVDKGVADQAVEVSCDKSLDGLKTEHISLSFMGMPIDIALQKAACPTITGILKVDIKMANYFVNLDDTNDWRYNPVLRTMTLDQIKDLKHMITSAVEAYDSARYTIKEY